jgi:molecular chaperone GrpE
MMQDKAKDGVIEEGKSVFPDTSSEANTVEGGEDIEVDTDETEEIEEIETPEPEELEPVDRLQKELEAAQSEATEYYDRWIRLAAEFDNYRKRMSRQFEDVIKGANENLIEQLLPVLDNFERALNHAQQEQDNAVSFAQGVALIFGQFKKVLEGAGLRAMEAEEKPFDPEYHDAMMQMESEDHDSGTVLEVIEQGYLLNGRVLRHAKVVVSK